MRNAQIGFAAFIGAAFALFALTAAGQSRTPAAQDGEVRDLPIGGGRTVRILHAAPASARAALVMLPGGTGDIGIGDDGDLDHGKNFLVRTQALWLARGYAVIIPDAVDGKNMRGQRSAPEFADLVGELVRFARSELGKPVFLIGTSQGSIAAMNGASHLSKDRIAGVVLTESVTQPGRKSRETVFDASPERVAVPALVVANRDSRCRVAPASDAPRIASAMKQAPDVKLLYVEGGVLRSKDCGSQSPHGYWGIEDKVVDGIASWLDAHD